MQVDACGCTCMHMCPCMCADVCVCCTNMCAFVRTAIYTNMYAHIYAIQPTCNVSLHMPNPKGRFKPRGVITYTAPRAQIRPASPSYSSLNCGPQSGSNDPLASLRGAAHLSLRRNNPARAALLQGWRVRPQFEGISTKFGAVPINTEQLRRQRGDFGEIGGAFEQVWACLTKWGTSDNIGLLRSISELVSTSALGRFDRCRSGLGPASTCNAV